MQQNRLHALEARPALLLPVAQTLRLPTRCSRLAARSPGCHLEPLLSRGEGTCVAKEEGEEGEGGGEKGAGPKETGYWQPRVKVRQHRQATA